MAFIPFPAGTVLAYAGATAPSGWLMCDGSAYSRTEYADAYAAIGVLYGAGNGSTTFNVPDLRGVFMRGSGTNGTSNYGGVTGHTPAGGNLATKGGQKTAKNGLSNGSSNISALTLNSSGISGSTGNENANHVHSVSHGHGVRSDLADSLAGDFLTGGSRTIGHQPRTGGIAFASDTWYATTENPTSAGISANHQHAISSGTAAAQTLSSGTAAAQTISSTDTETAPAALAVNYIIKI